MNVTRLSLKEDFFSYSVLDFIYAKIKRKGHSPLSKFWRTPKMARQLGRDDYTVGWVCALSIELAAAQEMLDEEHQDLLQIVEDANIYSLGRIGEHNIVIAGLPAGQTGIASATAVAMRMKSSFPSIRFGLMVGIGGGVPSTDADIRLGDIVVSQPEKGHGGVIQYDFGKSTPNGFEQTGFLNTPPPVLLSAITKLQAYHDRGRNDLSHHLAKLSNLPKFARDRAGSDLLFDPKYDHEGDKNCTSCEDTRQIEREDRMDWRPVVHYGTIASGNQVMRDGRTRDKVVQRSALLRNGGIRPDEQFPVLGDPWHLRLCRLAQE